MLKTAAPLERLTLVEISDGKGGDDIGSKKLAKKLGKLSKGLKLSKLGNSKGKNLAKSKEPAKSGNSPNFDAKAAGLSFSTSEARAVFNRLRLAFTKAPILRYFDPECHIWIKINILGYAFSGVLNQLVSGISLDGIVTRTDLSQWHLVAFFSRKIISAKTQYKTYNSELLVIVEAFKT